MFRRGRRVRSDLREAYRGFSAAAAAVERAKEDLLGAIPSARSPGRPLPDALTAFREGLDAAELAMGTWRRPDLESAWEACRAGIGAARMEEERFRLEAPPLTHTALLAALGDLIAPLEPFAEAARAFRASGPA